MPITIMEISALNATGTPITVRLATQTYITKPTDSPAQTIYDGRIKNAGDFRVSLFDGANIFAGATNGHGYIELNNADGALDYLLDYSIEGRTILLKSLDSAANALSSATLLLRAVGSNINTADFRRTLRINIRDRLHELRKPYLTSRYAGTTAGGGATAEGTVELKDRWKPKCLGSLIGAVRPIPVNPFDLIYQYHDGAGANVFLLWEGGVPLTKAADHPTLAALQQASIPVGQWASCNAAGLVRLRTPPGRGLNLFVEAAGGSAANHVERILQQKGYLPGTHYDAASFAALHTFNTAALAHYVDNEISTLDLINLFLATVGGKLYVNAAGLLQAVPFRAPSGAPVDTFTIRDLSADASVVLLDTPFGDDEGARAYRVTVRCRHNHGALRDSEIYDAVEDDWRTFFATEWFTETREDLAVQAQRPLSAALTFDTLFRDTGSAAAEAQRRLDLLKVRRDYISLTLPLGRGAGITVGQVVRVTLDRFGYDAGKLLLVAGVRTDFNSRRITLFLWG